MKNPEKAAAASCWIVNRLPRGADKVLAAHGYLRMAEAWLEKDSTNQESRAGLDIAQKMVEQLETEQILYLHNLAVNPYLELVEQNKPVQLISALYEDESIISRNRVASGTIGCPTFQSLLVLTVTLLEIKSWKHFVGI